MKNQMDKHLPTGIICAYRVDIKTSHDLMMRAAHHKKQLIAYIPRHQVLRVMQEFCSQSHSFLLQMEKSQHIVAITVALACYTDICRSCE